MARPNWEFVRVDVLLPDHPKLDGLSPAARWALVGVLVELWCYCGQHLSDGFVSDARWARYGTPRIRAQIIERGFAERVDGGYQMHDYLEHQRSRAEVEEVRAKRSIAGKRSAEARAKARALAQQDVEHGAEQTRSKPATEAEAEAEAEVVGAGAVSHPSRRNAHERDLIDVIREEVQAVTGRAIDREWAERVRCDVLRGRHVADPAAYIAAAIRAERDPRTRFLPVAASLPAARSVTEAVFAAGIEPGQRPASPDTVHRAAEMARQAITRTEEGTTP